jgi:hypothetical protein
MEKDELMVTRKEDTDELENSKNHDAGGRVHYAHARA